MLRPAQNGMTSSRCMPPRFVVHAVGDLLAASRECRDPASEWQQSSGKVGVPLGAGPRSPTISSSAPMQMVLRSMHVLQARARAAPASRRRLALPVEIRHQRGALRSKATALFPGCAARSLATRSFIAIPPIFTRQTFTPQPPGHRFDLRRRWAPLRRPLDRPSPAACTSPIRCGDTAAGRRRRTPEPRTGKRAMAASSSSAPSLTPGISGKRTITCARPRPAPQVRQNRRVRRTRVLAVPRRGRALQIVQDQVGSRGDARAAFRPAAQPQVSSAV